MPDIENWKKKYENGETKECPFCSGEDLEHACRHCYSKIDKNTCWEYGGCCNKCYVYAHEETPKIETLKKELGVKCDCNNPTCSKCLLSYCQDDNCPVHTLKKKAQRRATTSKFSDYKKRFEKMSDEELLGAYERERKNPGWVSSRAYFDMALRDEMKKRKIEL